jgi:hypothetical protein
MLGMFVVIGDILPIFQVVCYLFVDYILTAYLVHFNSLWEFTTSSLIVFGFLFNSLVFMLNAFKWFTFLAAAFICPWAVPYSLIYHKVLSLPRRSPPYGDS